MLSIKDNQQTLNKDIEEYVEDNNLRKTMDTYKILEKKSGRIERRMAFATCDIDWLFGKNEWHNLVCIGVVNTKFTTKKGNSDE